MKKKYEIKKYIFLLILTILLIVIFTSTNIVKNISNLYNIIMIDNYGLESFIKISNIVNRFNGKVAICDINNDVNNYIKSSDVFDYCFKSKNEESVVGVLNIWMI